MTAVPQLAAATAAPPLRLAEVALDAISEMVSVLGEDEVYRLVNRAWCRTMGLASQAVIGARVSELFPGHVDGERMRALRRCLRSNETLIIKGPLLLPHLAGRVFEATYTPYGRDHAGVPCVVVVTRDVTAQEQQREALAASHLDLERTLNTTGEAIFAGQGQDPDLPVRFVNQRLLQMWGIPDALRPTLTPRQIQAHAAPLFVDADAEIARIGRIVEQGLTQVDRLVLRDGRTVLRSCVCTPHAQGRLLVWSFRDISAETDAQRRLEIAQAKTRQLLDAFPGLIAELDHRLVYTSVNDAFLRVAGKPREEVLGHGVDELLGAARGAQVRALAARALAEGEVSFERWQRERCILVTMAGSIERDSGLAHYHGFGFDITDLKHAEQALIAARDEAESANRAKSQFLSNMSHELRTPLNAVLGFAQVLKADRELPAAQREQAAAILRGARHLHTLINDMLDLASIEAGRLTMEIHAVALLPLARECQRLVEPLAGEREVALLPPQGDLDVSVGADAMRLRQVLLNLLGNAIKYNRRGGSVALVAEKRGAQLRVEVVDNGPGLTPQQLERLFVPFERLHGERAAIEGTGIGLALSRRLVQGMGGQIGAESEVGTGSRFWFELPLHDEVAIDVPSAAATLDEPALRTRTQHVLYIEDNAVNIVLMEAMLMRVPGIVVHSEPLPLPGLERAFALRPDLILLDIQLPGLNGFEVLRRLRDDERTRDIPVVAVSANAMPDDVAAGRAAGFFDYLSKPVELPRLIAAVRRALAVPRAAAA